MVRLSVENVAYVLKTLNSEQLSRGRGHESIRPAVQIKDPMIDPILASCKMEDL